MRRRILPLALLSLQLLPPTPASAGNVYAARKVVGNLDHVAAFTFAPDGAIFFGERATGKIRVYDPSTKTKALFFAIPNVVNDINSELGLLGLALHPDYPTTASLYAYTVRALGGPYKIQLIRIDDTDGDGEGDEMQVIWKPSPDATSGGYHVGGRILFGPDGKLYVVVGDRGDPALAQDQDSDRGKILRMSFSPDGTAVDATSTYAYGVRNSFGLAFDPVKDRLWDTQNGPACNDELNRVTVADMPTNLAWGPSQTCSTPPEPPRNTNRDGPKPRNLPEVWWTPTIAPTGIAFCSSCDLNQAAEGAIFFGAFNDGKIRRVTLNAKATAAESIQVVYTHSRQVLSVEAHPATGRLYFTDGRTLYRLANPLSPQASAGTSPRTSVACAFLRSPADSGRSRPSR
ncbi:MAG TPA: PQQ-dependent sugar dehydrogenase [Actinomycetota bacterium]|nr:PQQ-dependent sugar dehydrogenase [Actinomycetota bacterium]